MSFPRITRFVFALMLLPIISGCDRGPQDRTSAPTQAIKPQKVRLVSLHRGEIYRTISLPGTVVPNQQAALFAKIAGYLKSIRVDKGDSVRKGDLLADIEAPELLADAAKFKADLDVAEINFRRITEAQQKAADIVPAQNVDTARAKFLAAKANLERAETLLGFCKVVAPFNGIVTRRNADPGAFIPAATSSSTTPAGAILVLMDFDTVRIQVAIPEKEVSLAHRGTPATFALDELPGLTLTGAVDRVSSALDEARTMLAEFDISNPEHHLLPGMYVMASIGIEKHQDALLAPADAVLVEKAGPSVFTVEGGKAKKLPVKTGFTDGKSIELLGGVPPESRVIVLGKLALANGQSVEVEE